MRVEVFYEEDDTLGVTIMHGYVNGRYNSLAILQKDFKI